MTNFPYIKKISSIILIASLIFSLGLAIGIFFTENEEIKKRPQKSEKFTKFGSSSISGKTQYSKTSQKLIAKADKNNNAEPLRQNLKNSFEEKGHLPRWINNSVPVFKQPEFSYISIVLDDMGLNRKRLNEGIELGGPLTLSFLSYAPNLIEQTTIASSKGHELMLHLPMEPLGDEDPGPGALLVDMKNMHLKQMLNLALEKFPNFIGVNNHMGSLLTQQTEPMHWLMAELSKQQLLFVDSRTSADSLAFDIAQNYLLPSLKRDVFLDHQRNSGFIESQFKQLLHIAKKRGWAVGIGHPYPETLAVLEEHLPKLKQQGVEVVTISALLTPQYFMTTAQKMDQSGELPISDHIYQ